MDKKMISVNVDVMKAKAAETAKSAASAARAKASALGKTALSGLLEKGIALSEKQMAALQSAKKRFE